MSAPTAPTRRWIRRAAAGVALGGVCGTFVVGCAASTSVDAALRLMPPAPSVAPVAQTAALPAPARDAPLSDAALPVRVQVPALRIDAALDPLHRSADGELVPPQYGRAGWYEAGPEPGERGPAVLAGHVDSRTGPDVFAELSRARAGDSVLVRLADGTTLVFVVDSVGVYPRDAFPTDRVYRGSHRRAQIRLITCGGPYDRSRGGYQDNVVVFGHLADRRG
jgi:hypothetical protein